MECIHFTQNFTSFHNVSKNTSNSSNGRFNIIAIYHDHQLNLSIELTITLLSFMTFFLYKSSGLFFRDTYSFYVILHFLTLDSFLLILKGQNCYQGW